MLARIACFCLCLSSGVVQSLKVVSDPATLSYHIEDTFRHVLFRGGNVAFFMAGKWCVHKSSDNEVTETSSAKNDHWDLKIGSRKEINGTETALGAFTGLQVEWSCEHGSSDPLSTTKILTAYKNFRSGNAVLLEVQWPEGALNTTVTDYKSAMTRYPSLIPSSILLPDALSWHGSFTQSIRGFSEGTQGGPTVFFNASDPSLNTVIVGSPWGGNWKSFSAGNNNGLYWAPGTSGRIKELPPLYKQSILLFQRTIGKGGGITGTLDQWGQTMQHASRQAGPWKLPDITLQKIGYQTDNGAMYCFCHDRNCSQTLLQEIDYLKSQGIPMGYLSFQGAGASSGRGKAAPWCVDTWGVDGGLADQYPMDLKTFQRALGLPLQLYAPYFCPNSSYFRDDSQWKPVHSDPALPGCKAYAFDNVKPAQSRSFYDWFMAKGVDRAGMVSFESDFMNQNYNCVPDFVQHATAAQTWQQGMAGAALAKNITIQWCYALPTDILASLDMPAVTNFRVSFDFCYGRSWDIGESSLLVWALGSAPSKDTLWSTDNNRTAIPGCPWTADHEQSAAELHVVLALMSNGPVGLSDAIGQTNAKLLKRIITKDGTLLKPSKPLTAVDSTFLKQSHPRILAAPSSKDGGYVYGTAGLVYSWYFVSFLLPSAFSVRMRDFWPPIKKQYSYRFVARRRLGDHQAECENGKDAILSGCVTFVPLPSEDDLSAIVFEAPAMLDDNTQGQFTPTVTAIWQPCPQSGWIMLGELGKYVPVSPVRFRKVQCTSSGVSVSVSGAPGETVILTALRPSEAATLEGSLEVRIRGGNKKRLRYMVVKKKVTVPTSPVESTILVVDFVASEDQLQSVGR
ncbi:expressed unknown protein [Seminavis robusta]|uniref:Uncharacterized protein n=1 Tax=Seminavis robusta TaxID=568900 RepID=A0A9N8EA11_9STRA|nr:expressed unknown protein [Seminavis robusta]|eukprot:Sro712_g191450.1 n/a (850) ;mRNA; r:46902-49451